MLTPKFVLLKYYVSRNLILLNIALSRNIDFQEMDDIEVAWQQNYIRNKSNPVWQGLVPVEGF